MKKAAILLIIATFFLVSFISFSASFNIWKGIEEAGAYEISGELYKAAPLWIEITKHFENQPKDEGMYTNLAIFYKKLGTYYDGIKEYEKAILYYENENKNWVLAGKDWGAEDLIRADEIRTIFEMYYETPSESKKLAKYEPEAGIYLGIYSENDKAIGQNFYKTEDVYGNHSMYLIYQDWNQRFNFDFESNVPIDTKLAGRAKDEGASLQIALNTSKGLESVEENEWIVDWAKAANELDMPIFLRFLGEMNGDWVPWNGDPELYKEKFRLVHDVMKEYAPNVVMVWTPNDGPIESNGVRIEDYYPGDNYVDWVGVNFYVDYYDSGNVNEDNNLLQNPLSHLDYIYEKYASKKPIIICETGIGHYSIPNNEDVTDWAIENLKKLYLQLPIKYPRVKSITYFSLNQANENYLVGNRWNNYAISENTEMHKVYNNIISSDIYLGKMSEEVNFTYKEIETNKEILLKDELYFIVKIPDYKISKIEFYNGNTLINTDKTLPYNLKTDFTKIDTLTVKIYDSKNELSLVKNIVLNEVAVIEEKTVVVEEVVVIEEPVVVSIAAGNLEVTVPTFGVNLNNSKIDNYTSKYPFLTYKGITYFPMTYSYSKALGLETSWSNETGLSIKQNNTLEGNIEYEKGGKNIPDSKYPSSVADYNISINGTKIDNSKEEYPVFNYNNVTYFPLTWRFVVDEFQWSNDFSSALGLKITRK